MSPLWTQLLPGLFVRVDGIEVTEVATRSPKRRYVVWSIYGTGVVRGLNYRPLHYPTSRQAMAVADRLYPVQLQLVGQRALVDSL